MSENYFKTNPGVKDLPRLETAPLPPSPQPSQLAKPGAMTTPSATT